MIRRQLVRLLVLLALFITIAVPAMAQRAASIRYTVRFPAPQTNYMDIEAIVPTDGRATVEMFMAVWTPGAYLVREYERNVEAGSATAAGPAPRGEKTGEKTWGHPPRG